jgi:hypothetical protein
MNNMGMERLTIGEVKRELPDALTVKKIGNNTFKIEYANGNKAVRYHHTDVITETPEGKIILTSGGYRTPTTKERLNYSPSLVKIWQDKGIWYCTKLGQWEKSIMFYDGITFDKSGNLLSELQEPDFMRINRIKKQISGYVKLITKDNLPLPESGDCWLCLLRDTKTGESWGNSDNDHLQSHLDEGYLHGSLLVNAMREKGYDDRQIGLHYSMKLVDTFRRAVRSYLQKKLIGNIAVK